MVAANQVLHLQVAGHQVPESREPGRSRRDQAGHPRRSPSRRECHEADAEGCELHRRRGLERGPVAGHRFRDAAARCRRPGDEGRRTAHPFPAGCAVMQRLRLDHGPQRRLLQMFELRQYQRVRETAGVWLVPPIASTCRDAARGAAERPPFGHSVATS
jgi:hypothetical protein